MSFNATLPPPLPAIFILSERGNLLIRYLSSNYRIVSERIYCITDFICRYVTSTLRQHKYRLDDRQKNWPRSMMLNFRVLVGICAKKHRVTFHLLTLTVLNIKILQRYFQQAIFFQCEMRWHQEKCRKWPPFTFKQYWVCIILIITKKNGGCWRFLAYILEISTSKLVRTSAFINVDKKY